MLLPFLCLVACDPNKDAPAVDDTTVDSADTADTVDTADTNESDTGDSETACEPSDEVCDGLDNDCDGSVDEADAVDQGTWYPDLDADGYGVGEKGVVACQGPEGTAPNNTDCDDENADVNPGQAEDCDRIDNNCDGEPLEGVADDWATTSSWTDLYTFSEADHSLALLDLFPDNRDGMWAVIQRFDEAHSDDTIVLYQFDDRGTAVEISSWAPATGIPVAGHAVTDEDGRFWIIGYQWPDGYRNGETSPLLLRFDPADTSWTEVTVPTTGTDHEALTEITRSGPDLYFGGVVVSDAGLGQTYWATYHTDSSDFRASVTEVDRWSLVDQVAANGTMTGMAADRDGTVYVVGNFEDNSDVNHAIVRAGDAATAFTTVVDVRVVPTSDDNEGFRSIEIDANSNMYLVYSRNIESTTTPGHWTVMSSNTTAPDDLRALTELSLDPAQRAVPLSLVTHPLGPVFSSGYAADSDGAIHALVFGGTALNWGTSYDVTSGEGETQAVRTMAVDVHGYVWMADYLRPPTGFPYSATVRRLTCR